MTNAACFSRLSACKLYDHEKFIAEAIEKDEKLVNLRIESLNAYELGDIIGRGSYATVRVGCHRATREKVAVKQYDKFKLLDPNKRRNVLNEIMILAKMNHPSIIRLIGWIFSPHQVKL